MTSHPVLEPLKHSAHCYDWALQEGDTTAIRKEIQDAMRVKRGSWEVIEGGRKYWEPEIPSVQEVKLQVINGGLANPVAKSA